ncbi:MAG: FliG C-terminal domain-containing protein [Bacteriovorax sp.]
MEANNNSNSIFINGKAQIIEMLQHMPREERSRLLKNLKVRNPQLAEELTEQCFTFSDLDNLSDGDLQMIFQYITAPILGMALKNIERSFQRRLLSLANREYAEEAFRVLKTSYSTEKRDIKRAQNKIIEVLVSLKKRRQINL